MVVLLMDRYSKVNINIKYLDNHIRWKYKSLHSKNESNKNVKSMACGI